MRIKRIILFLNIFIPLVLGLLLYLFTKPENYISLFVSQFYSFPTFNCSSPIMEFINNWGCDFLWAYSLSAILFELFKSFKHSWIFSSLISISLGISMELLQYYNVVAGTFDVWDIIVEIIAVIVSILIIKSIFREEKT